MVNSRSKKYFAGLATGYIVTLVTIFVGLWLTPFSLRFLDREQYAIFTLSSDVMTWLILLDLGISAGLNVQIAQQTGKPDQKQLNTLTSTTFFSQIVLVIVVLLIGIGISIEFPNFFAIRPDLYVPSITVMLLMVVSFCISLITQSYSVLLIAHQQVYMDNLIRLALIIIRTGLTVIFLTNGLGLISIAISNIIAVTITSALAVWRTYRLLPKLSIRFEFFSWPALKGTLGLGIWFSLGGLAGILILNLDNLVTAKMVTLASVTTLTLTSRLYKLSNTLISQITNTARPVLGQMFGQGDKTRALKLYRQLFIVSTGGAIITGLALWTANQDFINWWVGSDNYGGVWLDIALALNLLVNCWVLPNRAVLSSALVVKPQTISRLVEGLLNLIFSILLGLKFGLLGIILGTSIASILTSFWYLPSVTAKLFGLKFGKIIAHDFFRPAIITVLLVPLAWLVRQISIPTIGLISAALKCSLIGIVGFLILWFIGFDKELRNISLNWFIRASSFLKPRKLGIQPVDKNQ